MPEHERTTGPGAKARVTVSVKPEWAPRLGVGTRWEVVASSLGSLWDEVFTVTLEEIEGVREVDSRTVRNHDG